jgi:TRAP-type C4-dicarboxylate transport system permease small subunit
MSKLLTTLHTRAENVLALMMATMFVVFTAQVAFRYVLNLPLGWTDELSNFLWLWGILWGAAFVMRSHEDIRFDMLYNLMSAPIRRLATLFASGALVLILIASLPATWSYVSFMKVEKSASLLIPMNWVYSIYILFVVAMVLRHVIIAWNAWHGRLVQDPVLSQVFEDVKGQQSATPGASA